MDTRPSADASPMGSVVLGESHGTTSVDPFGEADPVEAARVVRRALAAADRKAFDVRRLVVVRDARPDAAAMARFARRALGPHGSTVPTAWVATSTEAVARDDVPAEGVWVELLVGPGSQVRARCRRWPPAPGAPRWRSAAADPR